MRTTKVEGLSWPAAPLAAPASAALRALHPPPAGPISTAHASSRLARSGCRAAGGARAARPKPGAQAAPSRSARLRSACCRSCCSAAGSTPAAGFTGRRDPRSAPAAAAATTALVALRRPPCPRRALQGNRTPARAGAPRLLPQLPLRGGLHALQQAVLLVPEAVVVRVDVRIQLVPRAPQRARRLLLEQLAHARQLLGGAKVPARARAPPVAAEGARRLCAEQAAPAAAAVRRRCKGRGRSARQLTQRVGSGSVPDDRSASGQFKGTRVTAPHLAGEPLVRCEL
jgi:hypothetical protein